MRRVGMVPCSSIIWGVPVDDTTLDRMRSRKALEAGMTCSMREPRSLRQAVAVCFTVA